jgi:hypothetical protein
MNPLRLLQVTISGQMPIFAMPYVNDQDASNSAGGFFVAKDGTFGIIIDPRMSDDGVRERIETELRSNVSFLNSAALVRHNVV